jgi:hypothetical protein
MDDFKDFLFGILRYLISAFDSYVTSATNVLTLDDSDALFGALFTMAENIANTVIAPVASTIVAVCFLIDFIKTTMRIEMFKWESAFAMFVKAAITKSALGMSVRFITVVYQSGTEMITSALSIGTGAGGEFLGGAVTTKLDELFGELGWAQALAIAIIFALIFIGIMIAGIFILVMAYGRTFEIILYMSAAPLAFAFIPLEHSGVTKRYVLHFSSIVLQGMLMVIVIKLFTSLMGTVVDVSVLTTDNVILSLVQMVGMMLIGVLTLVTLTMKSGSIAKEILSA